MTLYTGGLDFSGPVEEYFISGGKSIVDSCINLTGFALVGGPASQARLLKTTTIVLQYEVISGLSLSGSATEVLLSIGTVLFQRGNDGVGVGFGGGGGGGNAGLRTYSYLNYDPILIHFRSLPCHASRKRMYRCPPLLCMPRPRCARLYTNQTTSEVTKSSSDPVRLPPIRLCSNVSLSEQDHAKAVSTLQKLNVPYLCTVPLVFQSFEEWQASELGLHPIQVALQVLYTPEYIRSIYIYILFFLIPLIIFALLSPAHSYSTVVVTQIRGHIFI